MEENGQKKILIVDDDSVVLRTIKDGLAGKYKVFGANSGANAMKVLGRMPVDLILLDYEMPEMNGPQVLQALRADPDTAPIPVMFLTGLQEEAMQTGGLDAAGCLQKSMPLAEIVRIIDGFFA